MDRFSSPRVLWKSAIRFAVLYAVGLYLFIPMGQFNNSVSFHSVWSLFLIHGGIPFRPGKFRLVKTHQINIGSWNLCCQGKTQDWFWAKHTCVQYFRISSADWMSVPAGCGRERHQHLDPLLGWLGSNSSSVLHSQCASWPLLQDS